MTPLNKKPTNKPSKKIQTEEPRTYTMEYRCTNCGFLYHKEFRFGQDAGRGDCTNCGCDYPDTPTDYRY